MNEPTINTIPDDIFKTLLSKLTLLDILKLRLLNQVFEKKTTTYLLNTLEIKQIACGRHHTVLLLNDGRILSMGSNSHGQSGLGATITKASLPTEITTRESIQEIAAHGNTTICRTNNGDVWVLGENKNLGLDNTYPKNFFLLEKLPHIKNATHLMNHDTGTAVLMPHNTIVWLGYNDCSLAIYSLPNNQMRFLSSHFTLPDTLDIKDIASAKNHALILTEDGLVYGIGEDDGKLGLGLNNTEKNVWHLLLDGKKVSSIHVTTHASYMLTLENELFVGGDNRNGQLGSGASIIPKFKPIPGPRNINFFAANAQHTFIYTHKNQLIAVGENQYGELGIPISKNESTSHSGLSNLFGISQKKSWQHITEKKPKPVRGFFALKNHLEKESQIFKTPDTPACGSNACGSP